jgi:heme A synthase
VQRRRYRNLALAALGFTLLVILWGAYVRVTGSGAGCGSHWPTCNGDIVPRAPRLATVIEYTHRATSGVAFILVVLETIFAFVWLPKGSFARVAACASMFFMVTEALVGAGLVLFEKVAHDESLARGAWMSAHLVNTFLLLASMTATVWAAERDDRPRLAGRGAELVLLGAAVAAVLATGVTGAIAALGDTLFPARSLAEGMAQDLSHASHPFVQLRALHPFIAVATAVLLMFATSTWMRSGEAEMKSRAKWLAALTVGQVAIGGLNLVLAAPAAMQLVHLFAADAVWIALVVLSATVLSRPRAAAQPSLEAMVSSASSKA